MKTELPSFLRLALKADLDQERAYTICRLIDAVGWEIRGGDWDWDWLQQTKGDYRRLIQRERSIVEPAWRSLAEEEGLSLQTTSDDMPRVSTVVPLGDMTNLRRLVLQNNEIADLQPLAKMSKLKFLTIYRNKVTDLSPLADLQSLEILSLAYNPIGSLAVLEQLPKLRWLALSTDQVGCFAHCKRLPSVQVLEITGEAPVDNVVNFPEMPSLKVLRVDQLKDIAGIERFPSLSTLDLIHGLLARLEGVEKLKGLTHLEAWSSQPLSLQPLSTMYGLRCVEIFTPAGVTDLSALSRLPVLHEFRIGDQHDANKIPCNRAELEALKKSLTPWAGEFKAPDKKASPSLEIEIVSQETFDYYDTEAFGIKPGECEDGMFKSERRWLQDELIDSIEAMKLKHGDNKDFFVTSQTAFARSEGLVLYSLRAYERIHEIITAIQGVLCEARNDWIIYFQGLASEGPDWEELPEDAQEFTVWIYPDKIMATEKDAAVIRRPLD
jgi:hypothetical protein